MPPIQFFIMQFNYFISFLNSCQIDATGKGEIDATGEGEINVIVKAKLMQL